MSETRRERRISWRQLRVVAVSLLIALNALYLMTWVAPIALQPNYSHTRFIGYAILFALVEIVSVVLVYKGKAMVDDRSPVLVLVESVVLVLAGTVFAAALEGSFGYFILSSGTIGRL